MPKIEWIKLSDSQNFVAFLIDNEKIDVRIFVKTDSYKGATKKGFRFYLFDNNWTQSKKPIDKIDKAYRKML